MAMTPVTKEDCAYQSFPGGSQDYTSAIRKRKRVIPVCSRTPAPKILESPAKQSLVGASVAIASTAAGDSTKHTDAAMAIGSSYEATRDRLRNRVTYDDRASEATHGEMLIETLNNSVVETGTSPAFGI